MTDCRNCQFENPDGARFCMSCGSSRANRCPECGTELPQEARVCLNCGHQMTQTSPAEAAVETARANLERYIPSELLDKLEAAKAGGRTEGERRIVTMLFCDVSGSTAAAEKLDPEEWAQIMNGAFENLIAPVYRYEGTLARLMGDAILAFFGAPIGHEDDPQRAVLAGLEIIGDIGPYKEQVKAQWGIDIEVRVGINTGLVVVGEVGSDLRVEYTALGDAINLAARMEQSAQPGTVQISADTHRLVEPLFEFEDLGLTEVKGKAEPVRTYRAISAKTVPGSLRGLAGLQAPLIGRDKEISALRQVAADLREGRGGIVTVMGEAGIGKSRLVQELRSELMSGTLETEINWLEAQGVSYDTTRPYAFFSQQLRQAFGIAETETSEGVRQRVSQAQELIGQSQEEIDNLADAVELVLSNGSNLAGNTEGETAKRKMYEALLRVWRQTSIPTVVFSEDLHWADPASVELLTHLFQLAEQAPILFFCVFRPERQAPSWQLRTTGETDFPHIYTELALAPLSGEESDQLFGSLIDIPGSPPELRQMVLAKTEGNPLFVEELIRTLMDTGAITQNDGNLRWNPAVNLDETPIPENLQALLTSRIDRLEDDARRTLQLSAVIGRSFYRRVLERISDPGTALDREISTLQRSELIREASRVPELEYSFKHDLTRDAAYSSILLRARKDFRLRVGETVEELFDGKLEEQARRLAYHFYEAGADERAL
ncbi:MAG: AAA family ATPase, partial [Chloroflexi bacterium]|nr:AAA family ATPase [Chloroflexota bacterium]